MFLDFFQMREDPFGVTPDPAYLYLSRTHFEALDALRNGIVDGRGFLALIAEPGMGKTTLLYQLLDMLPEQSRVAFIFQTQCNSREFFQYLLNELGVDTAGMGLVAMHKKLNEMMFDEMLEARRFVLIVDEAQNLDERVLETIRLLSNFETPHSKLLQIVLAGQPELGTKLKQRELAQLLQRISVVKHLNALSAQETANYVRHRLGVAGYAGPELFEPNAIALIHERSRGVPRIINKLCYNALSEAQFEGRRTISAEIVARAQEHVDFPKPTGELHARADLTDLRDHPSATEVPADATPVAQAAEASRDSIRKMNQSWRIWIAASAALLIAAGFLLPREVRTAAFESLRDKLVGAERLVEGLLGAEVGPAPIATPSKSSPALVSNRGVAITSTSVSDSNRENANPDLAVSVTQAYTIVIDPGHGGSDPGLRGPHGLLEKDVCLEVALRLGQMIEEHMPNANVIYTRSDDRQISLPERGDMANRAHADVFISIHADSAGDRGEPRILTYYRNSSGGPEKMDAVNPGDVLAAQTQDTKTRAGSKTAGQSRMLAANIENSLSRSIPLGSGQASNRPRTQLPPVLKSTHMPAALSEISFGSGTDQDGLLTESGQRERIAEGLYRGIADYLNGRAGEYREESPANNDPAATSPGIAISSATGARDPS